MPLPSSFLDELRQRTPIAAVVGRKVRLVRSGRQLKACCPFHGEKTPSMYVYDDHFHCFGCGAHGDAISFVMQSEGATFMEAVERLAGEAGLLVPKSEPDARERQRLDLNGVLEAAAASYRRRLFEPEGRPALEYLRGRGLMDDAVRDLGLGWSGEGRGALAAELARDGVTLDLLVQAGLMRGGEAGGERPVDLFFKRVMFPIRDRRGRIISFGGRALGDGQPKYVNGPETALFSKRRSLYGLDRAHGAVRKGATLIVAEGYMDVIALQIAGFGGAVAPLGTALTEEQLDVLWRLSPQPVLCFDGDGAGGRAASRAATLALPLLSHERTLCFVSLPAGDDPDSLIRREGPSAFKAQIDAARPLSEALYDMLREGAPEPRTPEERAAFRARLEAAAATIPDKALAGEYRRALLDRFFQSRTSRRSTRKGSPDQKRRVARPVPNSDAVAAEQGRILVAILLNHPGLLADVEHAFAELALPEHLARLRHALVDWSHAAETLDLAGLTDHLHSAGLAEDAARARSPLPDCARPDVMPAEAEKGWWHFFGLMHRDRLDDEVAEARRLFDRLQDGPSQRRLIALCATRDALQRGEEQDDAN